MSSFISYLISGISLGSVYAIIALGYTMVYGIAKMLNFAHGDVIMVGSYVVYVAVSGMGLNPILAILLSIIICTLMGVVIEGVAYRPLRNAASPLAVLITAIGVSYLLQNVALLIWGADTKSFSNVISLPSLKLAGGSIVITCTFFHICLYYFYGRDFLHSFSHFCLIYFQFFRQQGDYFFRFFNLTVDHRDCTYRPV